MGPGQQYTARSPFKSLQILVAHGFKVRVRVCSTLRRDNTSCTWRGLCLKNLCAQSGVAASQLDKYHMQKKYYSIDNQEDLDAIRAGIEDQELGCALIEQGRVDSVTYTLVLNVYRPGMIERVETMFEGMITETSWPE